MTKLDLILNALGDTLEKALASVPKTKKVRKYHDVSNMTVSELVNYSAKNKIPADAFLNSGSEEDDDNNLFPCLVHDVEEPLTQKDIEEFTYRYFNANYMKPVHDILTANGYKRQGVMSDFFDQFKNRTMYSMYVNNEYYWIEKYYSKMFVKP